MGGGRTAQVKVDAGWSPCSLPTGSDGVLASYSEVSHASSRGTSRVRLGPGVPSGRSGVHGVRGDAGTRFCEPEARTPHATLVTLAPAGGSCGPPWASRGPGLLPRSCQQLLRQRCCFDQPRAALLAYPVAVAADRDDVAMVQQPVEDGGGDDSIAEDAAPLADRAGAGDQHRAALIAARDQLKEHKRRIGLEWQVAEVVDDQQPGFGEEAQPLLQPAPATGPGQRRPPTP